MIDSSRRTPNIVIEQQSTSCFKITCNEFLALVTSTAFGALVGVAMCFAISNPVGAVVVAIILTGILSADLICLIAILANRLFRPPNVDQVVEETLSYHTIRDESFTSESQEEASIPKETISQLEDLVNDSKSDLFNEQRDLLQNLKDIVFSSKRFLKQDLSKQAVEFIESFGFKPKQMNIYEEWYKIWNSDSIPRYPHLINWLKIVDLSKVIEPVVKGFFWDKRPFIIFRMDRENVRCSDISGEENSDAGSDLFIIYDDSLGKSKKYVMEQIDLDGHFKNSKIDIDSNPSAISECFSNASASEQLVASPNDQQGFQSQKKG